MNNFEKLRDDVKRVIQDTCCKHKNSTTFYNWQFGNVCVKIEEHLGLKTGAIPAELKEIIRFEFNKFKDSIFESLSKDYELVRTREGFGRSHGEIVGRLTQTSERVTTLEEKVRCVKEQFDRVGKQLAVASQEKAQKLKLKQAHLFAELDLYQKTTEELQKALAEAEVNSSQELQAKTALDHAHAESK
jgi:hypothetical protein